MLELITAKPDGGFVAVRHWCAVTKQGLHIFAAHHLPMAGEDPDSIYKWQNFISARVQLMPPGRWGNQRSGLAVSIMLPPKMVSEGELLLMPRDPDKAHEWSRAINEEMDACLSRRRSSQVPGIIVMPGRAAGAAARSRQTLEGAAAAGAAAPLAVAGPSARRTRRKRALNFLGGVITQGGALPTRGKQLAGNFFASISTLIDDVYNGIDVIGGGDGHRVESDGEFDDAISDSDGSSTGSSCDELVDEDLRT